MELKMNFSNEEIKKLSKDYNLSAQEIFKHFMVLMGESIVMEIKKIIEEK